MDIRSTTNNLILKKISFSILFLISINTLLAQPSVSKTETIFRVIDYELAMGKKDIREFDIFYVEQTPAILLQGYYEIGYNEIALKLSKAKTISGAKEILLKKDYVYEPMGSKTFVMQKGIATHVPFNRLEPGEYKIELLFLDRIKDSKTFTVSDVFGHEK